MGNRYQELTGDVEALQKVLQESRGSKDFVRYQAVYLRLAKNYTVAEIAAITGYTAGWVRALHSVYRREGLAGLKSGQRGGRNNQTLTLEEEKTLLAAFTARSQEGQLLVVGEVHKRHCAQAGKPVSLMSTYRLLHRHGWRKVAPRPRHPKGDVAAQEDLKKMASDFRKS